MKSILDESTPISNHQFSFRENHKEIGTGTQSGASYQTKPAKQRILFNGFPRAHTSIRKGLACVDQTSLLDQIKATAPLLRSPEIVTFREIFLR